MLSIQTARQKLIFSILLLPLALGLAACGSKEAEKPASQVAAKVNSGEISVHLINYVLTRTGADASASTPEMAPKIRRQVLDRLVDQELAVEQAVEKKLDRSPDVLMAVDAARREILARAYFEQITGALAKPTTEEARKYYNEHPQLFAERRIYNIQEIMLPATAGVAEQLGEMLNAGKSMDDVVNWLKSKDIKFSGGSATRPAEQIPLELLPKIHTLKVGQIMVITNPQAVTVMRIAAAQSAPVNEDAALPRIQQFLGNQRAAEALKQELKQLKTKAKITYMGEFANTENSSAAPQAAALPPPAADASASKPATDAALEKGIAGLK